MKRPGYSARTIPSLLAGTLLLLSKPSLATFDAIDMPLDELVKVNIISTPKFAENTDQIPSVVSILTAEDIRLYGWRTLGDALRTLQGFNVTDDATYGYAGVRGISQPGDYRPRLQMLIDGLSVNENIYASSPVDSAFPLDIGLVVRIEVIRGPSAAIYGGDAMFGVINIVTRSGYSINGSEIGLSFGSGADRRLRATWGGQVGGTDVLVSASGFDANGRTRSVNDVTGDGSAQRIHGIGSEDGNQLFVKVRGMDWSASFIHAERDRVVPHGSYGTIPDDTGHVESDHYDLFQLAKNWKLDARNTLEQRLNIGAYGYDGQFPYDYSSSLPSDPRVMNIDKVRGNWWGIENRLINTAWSGHRLTLGIEYKANTRQDQLNYDRGYGCFDYSTDPCLDDRRQSKQFTLMAQDEIQIGSSSLLTVGLSHNRQEGYSPFWSPRLGFVHDAGGWGLFKALYGTAFRAPSVYERAYIVPSIPYGNPALRPEKMRSFEVSWEKRFSPQSRLTATAYHFDIERMVTVDNTGLAVNGTPVRANGLEVEYDQQWSNGSRLRTGYSVQYAADEIRRQDNSPRHMVKLNLAVPTGIPGLMAGLEGQWISSRLGNAGSDRLPSYTLANFNLRYAPAGSQWELGLGIYNLFDHRYSDPVAVDDLLPVTRWQLPQQGRSAVIRTTLRF
jgi:iron complex outermembrane receptor protein